MFGGDLPVFHPYRDRGSQKEWATVLTSFPEGCWRVMICVHECAKRKMRENRSVRREADIHENAWIISDFSNCFHIFNF